MAKQQKKKTPIQNKKLSNYIKIQNKKQQPLGPPSTNGSIKRPVSDLRNFLSKQDSISPPSFELKKTIHYHLKNVDIQMLIVRCQNLRKAVQKIQKETKISKDQIRSVLQRNFQGNSFSLWGDKYFPRNIKQTLQRDIFCDKIANWIKCFFHYRNTIVEQSNSFFDDNQYSVSCSLQNNIKEFDWKLKGLIIKGRDGVGKSSLLKAIAKQMKYDIYHCGNDNNQIKYLKQKNQATQSESVKIKINKHDALIHRTNKSITQFTTIQKEDKKKEDKKKEGQTRKIQFMHNVNNFYPQIDSVKFYSELNKSIQSSKIPFVMTLIGQKVPDLLKSYDVIEYEQPKLQNIAKLIFLIIHIQKNVTLNKQKEIQKQKLYEEINNQFQNFHFNMLASLKQVQRLVKIFDGKLDKIFTFIQENYFFKLSDAEKIQKMFLSQKKPFNLLQDYFYTKKQHKTQHIQQDKNCQIDVSKYMIEFQQNILMKTPQKTLETKDQEIKNQKTITIKKDKQNSQSYHNNESQLSLKDQIRQLKQKVIEDQKCKLQKQESFIFNKLANLTREFQQQDQQQQISQVISIPTHFQIRNIIIQHLKKQYQEIHENCNFNIKAKQLLYLPMILGVKGRSSRKNKMQISQLSQFLNNQEINFLNSFSHFIKSE